VRERKKREEKRESEREREREVSGNKKKREVNERG
jgi:hypothetical protein